MYHLFSSPGYISVDMKEPKLISASKAVIAGEKIENFKSEAERQRGKNHDYLLIVSSNWQSIEFISIKAVALIIDKNYPDYIWDVGKM